jgi:Ni/Co efflux regulator RcnB
MKKIVCSAVLSLLLAASLAPSSALADSRGHRAAMKLCKQRYKDAVRGIKRLKSHQRKARIEQAQKERDECEKLAPK